MNEPARPLQELHDGFSVLVERARQEGVNDPADLPFLQLPEGPVRGAILLVHGFTATPREMQAFGDGLVDGGFAVLGVRLPGHGTSPRDLADRRGEEWLAEVEDGWDLLNTTGLPIFGLGLSTGALLLLRLSRIRSLAGVVLLSPFLRLQHPLAPLVSLIAFFKTYQERPEDDVKGDFYYRRRPLRGIAEIRKVARRVKADLSSLRVPALVVGADGDRVVDVDSGFELYRRLGSTHKEYHRFGPLVPHVLTTEENPHWRQTLGLSLAFFDDRVRARHR